MGKRKKGKAQCPMTPDASTERQSLQRGEPAQRAASETSARHWLPHAQCPNPFLPLLNYPKYPVLLDTVNRLEYQFARG